MIDTNLVIVTGRMTRDPDCRTTNTGTAVADFGIAVGNGESTYFGSVTAWNHTADYVRRYGRKALKSPYRKNAIWVLNDSTIKAIRKLKDHNGQYLWQPALRDGEYDTILGKRIFTSPYAPEIGAGAKSIAFGDFSYYWIGDRQGVSFKRLNERYAETGQVGFIATKRVDAKLILPEAIKVLQQKGSAN